MAKRQTKSNTRKRCYTDYIDGKHVTSLPDDFGRGANITFILPSGERVASNPRAFRKLTDGKRHTVVAGVCAALNIPLNNLAA